MDEKAQLSAEMILLIGAILVIVIVAGGFIYDITDSIAGNITSITETAPLTACNCVSFLENFKLRFPTQSHLCLHIMV